MSRPGSGGLPRRRRHAAAARAGYYASSAVLAASGVLLAEVPHLSGAWFASGACAAVAGLSCRFYLRRGPQ